MTKYRYRLQFDKGNALRFIGHLDLHRALERTLRRARLPIAFSEGYNPRARINIGLALPLGCTSAGDLLDLWLTEQLDPEELSRRINEAAPPGLEFHGVRAMDLKAPNLQQIITAAEFEVQLAAVDLNQIEKRVSNLLTAESLPRERRGKRYDLRPLIESMALGAEGLLTMRLKASDGATGRPDEVLRALELEPEDYAPHRGRLCLSEPEG